MKKDDIKYIIAFRAAITGSWNESQAAAYAANLPNFSEDNFFKEMRAHCFANMSSEAQDALNEFQEKELEWWKKPMIVSR